MIKYTVERKKEDINISSISNMYNIYRKELNKILSSYLRGRIIGKFKLTWIFPSFKFFTLTDYVHN